VTTGGEALIQTAVRAGVDVCFANPGTTELPLVQALDAVPGVRSILGLFEGVCTGAADGFGRMSDRPALTLLHLGPGFANGIANLHNARRAHVPVVNLIGDQATWHLDADAPLTSDIVSLASPVSDWVRSAKSSEGLAADAADAIAASLAPPGRVATLIVPADCAWSAARGPERPRDPDRPREIEASRIDEVAKALRSGESSVLLLGPAGTRETSLRAAGRIAAVSGCRLLCDTFPTRVERGGGLPAVERVGYFPEQALHQLADVAHLVVVGTRAPVAFFGYPDTPSSLVPEGCRVHTLAHPEEDVPGALEALAAALGGTAEAPPTPVENPDLPTGPLTPQSLAAAVSALQPEGAIVMDEGATSSGAYFPTSHRTRRHSYLALTGGAIGQGLPCATGASIACPDRPVIALQADGSAAYTLQALWTQAREGLDVTTILCSNRAYRILQLELGRAGVAEPGPNARGLTDLSSPPIDWAELAKGFGVPGARATTADELVGELRLALSESGPHLIEAVL
jgi:acetolactate synthase-1/2/3 large subunit